MKLRTRILWISCIALLAASLLGDVLILRVTGKSLRNEAMIQAYQDFYGVVNELEKGLEKGVAPETKAVYLQYFFKNLKKDRNPQYQNILCFLQIGSEEEGYDVQEIYNHTSLSFEELSGMAYTSHNKYDVGYADYSRESGDYVVFNTYVQSDIILYCMVSMEDVKDSIRQLAGYILAITLGILAVTLVILYVVLKHVLQPLQELNETTKRLAEGNYDQRVVVRRKDEIGELEESFNKMAEAVETSTRNLEESEHRKTLFMGNLTHELKTPMTAMSGYAQTLLSTKLSPENQETALLYIYEECGRLERLSKKMMALLELDRETELILTDTPVEKLFEAASAACRVILEEKRITLECIQQGEHFPMDLDLMTDVLINLIDNGVKASEPGGKIILRACEHCIEVQDFGQGIPADEQEKIMEPFYMVDKSRSRKSGGAGLGLALTALIAKRHHIQIRVDSKEGEGTRMILQFV